MSNKNTEAEILKSISKTSSTTIDLTNLRDNSIYQYCRKLVKVATFIQWLAVPVFLIWGIDLADSYRTNELGVMMIVSSVILAIFIPYTSHIAHIPFDIADSLIEIKKKIEGKNN